MKNIAIACIATMLIPARLFAQTEPQPVCPLECNCGFLPHSLQVIGFGLQDDFALPTEPTAFPNSPVATSLAACGATLVDFDAIPGENGVPANAWFAEEVTGLFFVCDARIEVHVRATAGTGSDGTSDDHIYISHAGTGCPVPFAWSALLRDLPEANGHWVPGQDATFCLDLDELPVPGGTLNALYSILTGGMDVVVEDDSGVDSIVLSVCNEPDAVRATGWEHRKVAFSLRPRGIPKAPCRRDVDAGKRLCERLAFGRLQHATDCRVRSPTATASQRAQCSTS